MEAFATVDDLTAGWRELHDDEEGVAESLLVRASAYLAAMLDRRGVAIDPEDERQSINLVAVTCNMVKRAMNGAGFEGIQQLSESATPYTVSTQFANPNNDWYLSRADKEALGLSRKGSAMSIRPAIHNPDGSLVDGW